MIFNERIKKLRHALVMTQAEFGQMCGMADSAVRRYEAERSIPKISTLKKIADAVNLPVSFFTGEQPFQNLEELEEARGLIIENLKNNSLISIPGDSDNQNYIEHSITTVDYWRIVGECIASIIIDPTKSEISIQYNKINKKPEVFKYATGTTCIDFEELFEGVTCGGQRSIAYAYLLLTSFNQLTEAGKEKAASYTCKLAELPQYKAQNTKPMPKQKIDFPTPSCDD